MTTVRTSDRTRPRTSLKGLRSLGLDFDTLPKRISTTNATRLRRIERITEMLDTAYPLPGTRMRVGLDSLIGLVPVAGDTITALISCYIVYEARKMGLSRVAIAKMLANIAIDAGVGAVPLLGDVFDLAFKANVRNLKVVRAELERSASRNEPLAPAHFREPSA